MSELQPDDDQDPASSRLAPGPEGAGHAEDAAPDEVGHSPNVVLRGTASGRGQVFQVNHGDINNYQSRLPGKKFWIIALVVVLFAVGGVAAYTTGAFSGTATAVAVGARPQRLAVSPDGSRIFVANYQENSISEIDSRSHAVTTYRTPLGPNRLVVSPDSKAVYVACSTGGSVAQLQVAPNSQPKPISASKGPDDLALDSSGTLLAVTNYDGKSLSLIDLQLQQTREVSLDGQPYDVRLTADGKKAYVTDFAGNAVWQVDTVTARVTGKWPVGLQPYGLALNRSSTRLYVADSGSGEISVIDLTAAAPHANNVKVGTGTQALVVSPDDARVFAVNSDSNNTAVLDTATLDVQTVPTGDGPSAIAITPDGKSIVVVDSNSDDVTVVASGDLSTRQIPVGKRPTAVAVAPDGHTAYVSNNVDGTVSFVRV